MADAVLVEITTVSPLATVLIGVEAEVALRILQPIVENACQCAQAGVTLGVERRDGEVLFTVDDDGPGVLPGECERIFEPGVRGSVGDSNRAFPGAGLGLALSRRLARAATGDVVARTAVTAVVSSFVFRQADRAAAGAGEPESTTEPARQLVRRYTQIASGAQTSTMPAHQAIDCRTHESVGPPSMRARAALAVTETGW